MKTIRIIAIVVIAILALTGTSQAKYVDDKADLVYFGYRYYSPTLGRWLNRDPLGEPGFNVIRRVAEGKTKPGRLTVGAELIAGPNLYEFVVNAPVGNIDPLGLDLFLPYPGFPGPFQPPGSSSCPKRCCIYYWKVTKTIPLLGVYFARYIGNDGGPCCKKVDLFATKEGDCFTCSPGDLIFDPVYGQ